MKNSYKELTAKYRSLSYPSDKDFDRYVVIEIRNGKTTVHLDHVTKKEAIEWLATQPQLKNDEWFQRDLLKKPEEVGNLGDLFKRCGCQMQRVKIPGHKALRDAYHKQQEDIEENFRTMLFSDCDLISSCSRVRKAYDLAVTRRKGGDGFEAIAEEFIPLVPLIKDDTNTLSKQSKISLAEKASVLRSNNYWEKSAEEQWEEDKQNGLLDWDGK